jgi:hypothetical protein
VGSRPAQSIRSIVYRPSRFLCRVQLRFLGGGQGVVLEQGDPSIREVRPNPPAADRAIVFTGSSSIRFWETLAHDMAPLNVVNRGFGGSQMAHVTCYATKIVLPFSPSAVMV